MRANSVLIILALSVFILSACALESPSETPTQQSPATPLAGPTETPTLDESPIPTATEAPSTVPPEDLTPTPVGESNAQLSPTPDSTPMPTPTATPTPTPASTVVEGSNAEREPFWVIHCEPADTDTIDSINSAVIEGVEYTDFWRVGDWVSAYYPATAPWDAVGTWEWQDGEWRAVPGTASRFTDLPEAEWRGPNHFPDWEYPAGVYSRLCVAEATSG